MRFILVLVFAYSVCPVAVADWPRFGGPHGDFTSPEMGILTHWPDEGLREVWSIETGEGYCQPTVAKGRLYLFDRLKRTQRLRCLDAKTGKERWSFEYPTDFRDMYGYDGGPRACPVVDGDRVYILGPEGMLHCLSTQDGSVQWKMDTMDQFKVLPNFFGVGSAPVVEGELLVLQVGGSPPGSPPIHSGKAQGNGTGIVALNKMTGQIAYTLSDELASYSVPVFADIDGRRWGFVFARGGLVGFDPVNAKIDFHFPWRAKIVESVNASNPVVVGDRVFIGECYGEGAAVLRVKPGGYDVLWSDAEKRTREKSMMPHWMTPIHIDGFLYGSSGRNSGDATLRCVRFDTGEVMWSVPRLTRSSLTLVDGHLLVLTEFGQLLLVKPNPERFEVVAAYPNNEEREPVVEYPAWAAPVVSDGLLYLRGKGKVVSLELIPEKMN